MFDCTSMPAIRTPVTAVGSVWHHTCKNRVEKRRLTFLYWYRYTNMNNGYNLQAAENTEQCGSKYTSRKWDWRGNKHIHLEPSNVICSHFSTRHFGPKYGIFPTKNAPHSITQQIRWMWHMFCKDLLKFNITGRSWDTVRKWRFSTPKFVNKQNSDTSLQNLYEIYSYPWILIGVLSHFIGRHIRTLKRNMVQWHAGNHTTTWNRDLCAFSKRASHHILQAYLQERSCPKHYCAAPSHSLTI